MGVSFASGRPADTLFLDGGSRAIELSPNGGIMGLEFQRASNGIRLLDLPVPRLEEVVEALRAEGLSVIDVPTRLEGIVLNRTTSRSSVSVSEFAAPTPS